MRKRRECPGKSLVSSFINWNFPGFLGGPIK
jgi:hypothetical protein